MSLNKEILYVIDSVSNEKGVESEVIFGALEQALASATRKKSGKDIEVRVAVDMESGEYESFRRWQVVEADEMEFPLKEITLEAAQIDEPEIQLGDYVEEQIDNIEFGRIAVQTAKQVIVQKVREAEREKVAAMFADKVGTLVLGTVKRVERGNVFVDIGDNVEAMIHRDDLINRENMRIGDRVRAYLREVSTQVRGPQLLLSRTVPDFLVELMKVEVPEVGQGIITIKSASRDPGFRAKVAVESADPRLDPVGACIGMRGSRIQTVTDELNGERVDVVVWNDDPVEFAINAMKPAEVDSVVVDETAKTLDIAVDEDNLSQAIGRGGQNVRLASELTGWIINVMSTQEADEKEQAGSGKYLSLFEQKLDVDADVSAVLVEAGLTTIEEIAYVPAEEMMQIEGFDEEIVAALQSRAKDALLAMAIAGEGEGLMSLDFMSVDMAEALQKASVKTVEDLAELGVEELQEKVEIDAGLAGELIMSARSSWFEDEA